MCPVPNQKQPGPRPSVGFASLPRQSDMSFFAPAGASVRPLRKLSQADSHGCAGQTEQGSEDGALADGMTAKASQGQGEQWRGR